VEARDDAQCPAMPRTPTKNKLPSVHSAEGEGLVRRGQGVHLWGVRDQKQDVHTKTEHTAQCTRIGALRPEKGVCRMAPLTALCLWPSVGPVGMWLETLYPESVLRASA
jgi:hypothetical protein